MINRLLRRFTVRQRIVGAFVVLMLALVLSAPALMTERSLVLNRVREVADVESQANRLLLLASARVESSRLNLMRYVGDYAPSAYQALDDVDQATEMLAQAQELMTAPEQGASVDPVLSALADYRDIVAAMESQRQSGEEGGASRLMFEAQRLGNDIGERIEQIVRDSEIRVDAANQEFYLTSQRRLIAIGVIYGLALALILLAVLFIVRSITSPVEELRRSAEAFRVGEMAAEIPVTGSDELSLLARTFNQMTTQLRDMIQSLEQRVAERTRGLQAAAEVAQVSTSLLDRDELLAQVVDLARERFDLYYVGLFLLDQSGRHAVLQIGSGMAGPKMVEEGHRLVVGGDSMIGQCVLRSEARIALDVGAEAVRFDNPYLPETRSELALPLRCRGRIIGAMTVQSAQEAAFDEASIAVMQTMADLVAVAIDNARLFAETQAAVQAAEETYQRYLGQEWTQYAQARTVSGYQYVREGSPIDASLSPLGDELLPEARQAMAEKRMVTQGDPADQEAEPMVVAPVMLREKAIGALGFKKRQLSQDEIALATEIAEQFALAADNLRLFEGTQRRAARDRLLTEVTARVRETLELETMLQTAAEEIREALGLERAVVRLAPDTTQSERGR